MSMANTDAFGLTWNLCQKLEWPELGQSKGIFNGVLICMTIVSASRT